MKKLTLPELKRAARTYLEELGTGPIAELYGITDGKAVGTFVEHRFHRFLKERCDYTPGSSAMGIDFPDLGVDLKVTSIRQPQSSCPFRDASQKVYGLGYHLLVFIYDKSDDHTARAARVIFKHAVFVDAACSADYQTTYGLLAIIKRKGNVDDVDAFLEERNLPLDEIGRRALAERILKEPPKLGCLTVSNALQWRLQYGRAITIATRGDNKGVENLLA
jgi:hypothetical protein